MKSKHKHKPSDQGVTAKKHLGQHFLKDTSIAQQIAQSLSYTGYTNLLEIGPGTGVLTQHLLRPQINLTVLEIDNESVQYLTNSFVLEHAQHIKTNNFKVLQGDFLKTNLDDLYQQQPFAIIGNYPYNISSQIVFKTIEHRHLIPEFGGMFQKEVAQRICATHGSKTYGILSILTQAYYNATYLFTVAPDAFNPPPRVDSGVLSLTRKDNYQQLSCSYKTLKQTVKLAFQQRRKTLRNSLKSLQLPDSITQEDLFNLRPEQISVDQFITLATTIEQLEP